MTARLFDPDCGLVIRAADDHGHRYVQVCTLAAGHAGPCEAGRWTPPEAA